MERLVFRLTPGCQPGREAEEVRLLGVNQPKVSALKHYKLDGFSAERLMAFLNALCRDVEIVVRKKNSARAPRHARRSWRREGADATKLHEEPELIWRFP